MPYTVSNAGDSNAGRHDIVSGTHGSVNTFYLQLLERTGVDRPAAHRRGAGAAPVRRRLAVRRRCCRGGSFVLGANEVSPLALTAAYAAFAAHGRYCPPTPVLAGRSTPAARPSRCGEQPCRQALEPRDRRHRHLGPARHHRRPGTRAHRAAGRHRPAGRRQDRQHQLLAAPRGSPATCRSSPPASGSAHRCPTPLQDVTVGGQHFRQVYGGTLPAPLWRDVIGPVLRGCAGRTDADRRAVSARPPARPTRSPPGATPLPADGGHARRA